MYPTATEFIAKENTILKDCPGKTNYYFANSKSHVKSMIAAGMLFDL